MVLGILLTGLIWLIYGVFFLFWLVLSIWSANKELGKLPYLETRERQLSLRFFKHHTAILILFLVGFETLYFLKHNLLCHWLIHVKHI